MRAAGAAVPAGVATTRSEGFVLNVQLPPPLVSAEVELDGFPGFMLNVDRFLSSELVALCSPEEGWAAFHLWCRAWKQRPPASLPNDERLLASFSGAGPRWKKVRAMALRGFVLCADGRLYHRVLAAEANEAWDRRKKFRERSEKANSKRWRGGDSGSNAPPGPPPKTQSLDPSGTPSAIQQGVLEGVQQGVQQGVLEHRDKESLRSPVDGTETGRRRDGDGEGDGFTPINDDDTREVVAAVVVDSEARAGRAIEIVRLCRARSVFLTGSDPRVLAWAEEGITDRRIVTAIDTATRNRVAAQSMQPITAGYLDPIIREDEAKAGRPGGRPEYDWSQIQRDIELKAQEVSGAGQ